MFALPPPVHMYVHFYTEIYWIEESRLAELPTSTSNMGKIKAHFSHILVSGLLRKPRNQNLQLCTNGYTTAQQIMPKQAMSN